jgi:hypothetical protein
VSELTTSIRAASSHDVVTTSPEPQHGDVVVMRTPAATPPFGVRQLPTGVQFGASTRDEAIGLARSFAQSHAVDLWYSEDGNTRLVSRDRNTARPD